MKPFSPRGTSLGQRLKDGSVTGTIPDSCPELGPCTLWRGKTNPKGYGLIRIGGRSGKWLTVHRVAYRQRHGAVPDGLCVLHHCDVRNCIEDRHHFLGTNADNNSDMMAKGRNRQRKHEAHNLAILNWESVRSIRTKRLNGATLRELGEEYGVHLSTIWLVVHNVNWVEEPEQGVSRG